MEVYQKSKNKWFLSFRDIARSTDERTSIIAITPFSGGSHFIDISNPIDAIKLSSIGSSIVFDQIVRQKVAGTHLNHFYVKQFPFLTKNQFLEFEVEITSKVIELIYSSWDIKSFADDLWEEADGNLRLAISNQWEENQATTGGHTWSPPKWCEDYGKKPEEVDGCPLPPFKWDEERRAILKAELDAIYAKLYGLTTEELRYILDPQDVYGPDFPGETFRVLKDKEMRLYGEYRTRRLVLEAWERMK